MGSLFAAMVAEISIITFRTYKQGYTRAYPLPMPIPADYVAAVGIFGALTLLSEVESARGPVTIFGWGLVIATLMGLWTPEGQVAPGPSPDQAIASQFAKPPATMPVPQASPKKKGK